jgi:hypothetical protein
MIHTNNNYPPNHKKLDKVNNKKEEIFVKRFQLTEDNLE